MTTQVGIGTNRAAGGGHGAQDARWGDRAARVPTARAASASTSASPPGRRARSCPLVELDGDADAGFGPVADAFARNFETLGEIGASVAVYHRGLMVVDLGGGTDPVRDRPFRRETLMKVASCTKGVTATCVLMLAGAG